MRELRPRWMCLWSHCHLRRAQHWSSDHPILEPLFFNRVNFCSSNRYYSLEAENSHWFNSQFCRCISWVEEVGGSLGRSDDRAEVRSLISSVITIYLIDWANVSYGTWRKEPNTWAMTFWQVIAKGIPRCGQRTRRRNKNTKTRKVERVVFIIHSLTALFTGFHPNELDVGRE